MVAVAKPLTELAIVERVAIITLNHPEKRNALSHAMLSSLRDRLRQAAADQRTRVIVLRANGPVFSAGHDLRELADGGAAEHADLFALCSEVMELIPQLPQPIIAEVQGLATAAGCQLVASCDLVVAADTASFATPGVKIGLFCTTPGVALCRAVPPKKALEMLLTGTPISAAEAEREGLVNRVVPAEQLHDETMRLAQRIIQASADALAIGKRAFYAQLPLDRPAAYGLAQKVMVENAGTPNAREGIRAFLEKRPPRWND